MQLQLLLLLLPGVSELCFYISPTYVHASAARQSKSAGEHLQPKVQLELVVPELNAVVSDAISEPPAVVTAGKCS